jgi:hypothetical protein
LHFIFLKKKESMSNYSATIKGQVWIYNNTSLVQDQVLMMEGANSASVITLIENIWEDLLSPVGQWKRANNNPKYFYWEFNQTDVIDAEPVDGKYPEVKVKIECPRPAPGFIASLFKTPEGNLIPPKDWDIDTLESDWAKYWAKVEKDTDTNYTEVLKSASDKFDANDNFDNFLTNLLY